jgi:hypothetical protein
MVFFSSSISPLTSTVIFRESAVAAPAGRDVGDVADLAGEVRGHDVHVVGEVRQGPTTPRPAA